MTRDQADSLLDDFLYWYKQEGNRYREDYIAAKKAVLDAMTQPAETIAEQQREIERLKSWIRQHAQHPYSCSSDQSAERKCTCGLDEVLKQ